MAAAVAAAAPGVAAGVALRRVALSPPPSILGIPPPLPPTPPRSSRAGSDDIDLDVSKHHVVSASELSLKRRKCRPTTGWLDKCQRYSSTPELIRPFHFLYGDFNLTL